MIPLALALALALPSCATRIAGTLAADGSADLTLGASLEPRMAALLSGFAAAGGIPPDAPLLDGPAMAVPMSEVPGVASVSLSNRSATSIEGRLSLAHIGTFLAAGGTDLISFEQSAAGGRLSVNLDLAGSGAFLEAVAPDLVDYLAALMAPIATGQSMTRDEYLFLVTSLYGAGIADEMSAAVIGVDLALPGPVQSAVGGSFSGSSARFAIPLLDVLVLDRPLRYEVVWR